MLMAAEGSAAIRAINPSKLDMFLAVLLNGYPTERIARFQMGEHGLSIRGADLQGLGVDIATLGMAPDALIDLDRYDSLSYRYDKATQTVDLSIDVGLLMPYVINPGQPAAPLSAPTSGLVLNYDTFSQTRSNARLALWSETRYFNGDHVMSNTATFYDYRKFRRYVRYDTYWQHADPATLRTTQWGDAITGGLNWTRSVRIGGFQWRKNFALRPDLVTFPLPTLDGTAIVPSAVDVYINSIRQFSGQVPNGLFVLNNIAGLTGAGQANIVTRDALGRVVSTTLPIYIDSRLMAAGLSAYSAEVGLLRRNYAYRSLDYDHHPAASGTYRYGFNDRLTGELHAEGTTGTYNAGVGGLMRMGQAGVVNASVATSTGRYSGGQVGLGYQYIAARYSFDVQALQSIGQYGDIATPDNTPIPTFTRQTTLSFPVGARRTVALNYVGQQYRATPTSHIGSAAFLTTLTTRSSLSVNAFKDLGQHGNMGVYLSLSISLGDNTSATVSTGHPHGQAVHTADVQRIAKFSGGWGYGVQAGRGPVNYRQGWLQYLGRYGRVTAGSQQYQGPTQASVSVNGAVVLMDGEVQAARQIHDGFALVWTNGRADVPVLSSNRLIGRTNSRGYLLVPDLNAYQSNRIAIELGELPADAGIEITEREVVPRSMSGVMASFGVTRYLAASVIVQDASGHVAPVGARVYHVESGETTVIGYDGLTFIDNLQTQNTLILEHQNRTCQLRFAYEQPADGSLPLYGPLRCDGVLADAP
jgi:outer membrane usher protein